MERATDRSPLSLQYQALAWEQGFAQFFLAFSVQALEALEVGREVLRQAR